MENQNTPSSNASSAPVSNPIPSKNAPRKKSKLRFLFIELIIFLGLVGGTLFITQTFFLKPSNSSNSNAKNTNTLETSSSKLSSTDASTATLTQKDGSSSDWKTYANTKFGYSIEYPSSWYVSQLSQGSNPDIAPDIANEYIAPKPFNPINHTDSYDQIYIYTKPSRGAASAQYLVTSTSHVKIRSAQLPNIDGIFVNVADSNSTDLFILDKNRSIVERISFKSTDRKLIDHVSQSFKFIQGTIPTVNPVPAFTSADTSNWISYTNTAYGYSFKLPSEYTPYTNDENPGSNSKIVIIKSIPSLTLAPGQNDAYAPTISTVSKEDFDYTTTFVQNQKTSVLSKTGVINGTNVIKIELGINTYYFLENGKTYLVIKFLKDGGEYFPPSLYDQIISTFKLS